MVPKEYVDMIEVCNAMSRFFSQSRSGRKAVFHRKTRQSGGILLKMSLSVFTLALVIAAAAVVYLGTASMPAPSQSVQKPIPDAQIKKRF